MPSSPTDGYDAIREVYDAAFEAVLSDELERVGALLDRADELIAGLSSGADGDTRDAAAAAWSRLRGALEKATADTGSQLARFRRSEGALRAYGGAARRAPGLRHDSEV